MKTKRPINRLRYSQITSWARRRYQCEAAVLHDARGIASRYCIIETLAAERYMGCSKRTRPARLRYLPFFEAPAR